MSNPGASNNPIVNLQIVATALQDVVKAIYSLGQIIATVFPLSTLTGSKTYDPPSIADGDSASTTVTVTGAVAGNFAVAAFSLSLSGLVLTAYVSAADTVTCVFSNNTGAPVDLGSGTLSVRSFG